MKLIKSLYIKDFDSKQMIKFKQKLKEKNENLLSEDRWLQSSKNYNNIHETIIVISKTLRKIEIRNYFKFQLSNRIEFIRGLPQRMRLNMDYNSLTEVGQY